MLKATVLCLALAMGIVSGLRAEEVTDHADLASIAPSISQVGIAH
jgi:hypothetical protein